jgi:hypothetical protein
MRFNYHLAAVAAFASALIVTIAPAVCAQAALTPEDVVPTPLMAPIKAIVRFVNTGAKIPQGTYSNHAVVADEFAPFLWTSGDVGVRWSAGFTAFNAASGITKPHIVLSVPSEFKVVIASRAYVVFPGSFTPLLDGKPFTETGFWTFVLVRDGEVWRVASQTWAGVTFK